MCWYFGNFLLTVFDHSKKIFLMAFPQTQYSLIEIWTLACWLALKAVLSLSWAGPFFFLVEDHTFTRYEWTDWNKRCFLTKLCVLKKRNRGPWHYITIHKPHNYGYTQNFIRKVNAIYLGWSTLKTQMIFANEYNSTIIANARWSIKRPQSVCCGNLEDRDLLQKKNQTFNGQNSFEMRRLRPVV